MNKKILYSVLFISIFLISTVAMVAQPAAGATWKFGVPDQAKGIEIEREVMVYDKDTWGDCKGYSMDDTANAIFGEGETGANDVGARGKYEITDWEKTDIWYFGDHLMNSRLGPSTQQAYGLFNRWDYFLFIHQNTVDLGTLALGYLLLTVGGMINTTDNMEGFLNQTLMGTTLPPYQQAVAAGTGDRAAITSGWTKTFEGTEIEREYWYLTKDFDSNPDEDDDMVPFIENPHDIWESYKYFTRFIESTMNTLSGLITQVYIMNATLHGAFASGFYDPAVQAAFDAVSTGILTLKGATYLIPLYYTPTSAFMAFCMGTLQKLIDALTDNYPDKKTYLTGLLRAGLPGYTPIDKWWEKVLDDFNIDDETIWRTAAYDYHQGGIYLDGMTVVVEFEWYYVQDWHGDKYEDRDDYEERYTYSDTGGQSVIEFTKGDDVFYRIESLSPAIPGYEITIFLAAAAISALGLIYVVMKKRRK